MISTYVPDADLESGNRFLRNKVDKMFSVEHNVNGKRQTAETIYKSQWFKTSLYHSCQEP